MVGTLNVWAALSPDVTTNQMREQPHLPVAHLLAGEGPTPGDRNLHGWFSLLRLENEHH